MPTEDKKVSVRVARLAQDLVKLVLLARDFGNYTEDEIVQSIGYLTYGYVGGTHDFKSPEHAKELRAKLLDVVKDQVTRALDPDEIAQLKVARFEKQESPSLSRH
jgi:hypothetical protein